jgi:hypothetical protein
VSSPSPEARELALLLVRKAEGDESILERLLDDSDVPDDVLGLPEHHGIDLSEGREQVEELTPWAVAARYEDRFEEVLDRLAVREQVSVVRDWSGRLLGDEE